MLSICIPVFNYVILPLVHSLEEEINKYALDVEILLIDDASSQEYLKKNAPVFESHHTVLLEQNIGRAKIRNAFLKMASHPFLLFLDCDVKLISPSFIRNYLTYLSKTPADLICGGRIYSQEAPTLDYRLRWKYGIRQESKPVSQRNKKPNASFMTNNFVIRTQVFERIGFDERILFYGHEDTLFGFELKQAGVRIHHIDNPVENGDTELNAAFLSKTMEGIGNLLAILEFIPNKELFIRDLNLLNFYYTNPRISKLLQRNFNWLKSPMKAILLSGRAPIFVFNLFKLGYLCQLMQSHNSQQSKSPKN